MAQIFFNTTTVTYALAYFLPVILQLNMGFSVGEAQCLVAPPYAFAVSPFALEVPSRRGSNASKSAYENAKLTEFRR